MNDETDWVNALWRLDVGAPGEVALAAPVGPGPLFADVDPWSFAWAPNGRHVLLQDSGGKVSIAETSDDPSLSMRSPRVQELGIHLYVPAGAGGGEMYWSEDGRQIVLQSMDVSSSELVVIGTEVLATMTAADAAFPPRATLEGSVTVVEGVAAGSFEYAIESSVVIRTRGADLPSGTLVGRPAGLSGCGR